VPLRPVVNALASEATRRPQDAALLLDRVPLHIILGVIVIICLAGTRLLNSRAEAAEHAVALIDPSPAPSGELFRGMASAAGPLVLTALLSIASIVSTVLAFTPVLAVVDAPLLFFVALPIAGFVWCYAVVLISVDRLGKRALALDPYPQDRTLGLRPVGSLVLTGFTILAVASALYLVFLGHYLTDIVIGVAVLIFGLIVFVLSLWRLHRQMAEAKKGYLREARELYAQAYAPLRTDHSVAMLEKQAAVLGAAEGVEKRAESIFEWPIDDGMLRTLAVIITGVVTSLVVRGVFALLGL
jgi:hypothetical protein